MKTKTLTKIKFAIQLSFIAFITVLLAIPAIAQTPSTRSGWGHIIKAKDKNTFSRVFQGAVHIGPTDDHPTNTSMDYASIPALEDTLLFVEQGIATDDVTYVFSSDWHSWPDYVFDTNYNRMSLDNLETYINENKHLPEVISQHELKAKGGVSDKEMTITLLKKIEELTLYIIEQHKALKEQKDINTNLQEGLKNLEIKLNSFYNNK